MNIWKKLYHLIIAPRQRDVDLRNRELVLNVLLAGTLAILLATFFILVGLFLVKHEGYMGPRALALLAVLAFVGGLYGMSRLGRHKIPSFLLVGVYFLLATTLVSQWGINIPTGILLFGLVIVLSGILLGPTYSLYTAAAVGLTLTLVVEAASRGYLHPDQSWTSQPGDMIDVAGFCLIFGVIALVSWLFNHQMERSLRRAERAEVALIKQKDSLEDTVHERTQELQTMQLEKIQQMYRFAELGQLSTALLHELANHLTTLTMDIEGLESQARSNILSRAKRSIRYIDDMVVRVRDQLHGTSNIRTFGAIGEIEEIIKVLRHKAQAADVLIKWEHPADRKSLRSRGEPIRLRQLMANLISNGIDAYHEPKNDDEKRQVQIIAASSGNNIVITVNDWGGGISAGDRKKLFEPFFSTKKTGMGMGLFIAKQIVEEHFLGSITIDETKQYTSFVVKLPKADP